MRLEDVVLVGLRRVDLKERWFLAEAGVRAYTMKEIDVYRIARVVDRVLDDLSRVGPPLLRPRRSGPENRSGCRHAR